MKKLFWLFKTVIIYDSKTSKVEIGLFKSKSKTLITSIVGFFAENIMNYTIDTSTTPKIYNLKKIQKDIEKDGSFQFKNTKEIQLVITQICHNHNGIFRTLHICQHTHHSFLRQIHEEKILKYSTIEKIHMNTTYKDVFNKLRSRPFFIECSKTNLSHNKIDTPIRAILMESGIQEITVADIKEVFQYVISKNGEINIFNAQKQGYGKHALEYLIENAILCVSSKNCDFLYCDLCKTETMKVDKMHTSCTSCGSVIFVHEIDITNYALNIKPLKERLHEYEGFKRDEKSQEPSYVGYLEYGKSGKINFHIVEEGNEVKNITRYGEQIVLYIYGEYPLEKENDLSAYPLINYLNFSNKQNTICFDKTKIEELKRVYAKNPTSTKTQNSAKRYNEAIKYVKSINKESYNSETLYNVVHLKHPTIGSFENFKKRVWKQVRTKLQTKGGRAAI